METKNAIKPRTKITEIDVIRAIAILAVVMIHATSGGTYVPTIGSLTQKLFFSINMFGSFAVPVFIFISGLVLFYGYFDRWKAADSFKFYGKRLLSVAYPYLVFSVFYYLYFAYIFTGKMSFGVHAFLGLLPWGDAGYHLYFMIIIAQFYLLFPILITLAKSSRLLGRGLALFGLIVQVGFYIVTYHINVPHAPSLFITYFAVFLIGASVGVHYAAVSAWARRFWHLLVALAVLIGASYVGLYWGMNYYKAHIADYWFHIAYNAFAIAAGIALIGFGKWLVERAPKLAKPLLRLGQMSFGIYLLHPAVLALFNYVIPAPGNILGFSLHIAAGFIVTVAVTWLIVEAYYKIKQTLRPSKGKRQTTSVSRSA
jgi:probable poly-beta-1,6-N-acetyl-D-glucosamine export protein